MSKKLDELVSHYGELDSKIKTLSKELDSDKVTIKNIMSEDNLNTYESGGFKVQRITSFKTKVDEDKMLAVLKKDWAERYPNNSDCPYIKTKEYIDMDELEAVIYAGELPDAVMLALNDCKEDTEVVTLRCSKVKK